MMEPIEEADDCLYAVYYPEEPHPPCDQAFRYSNQMCTVMYAHLIEIDINMDIDTDTKRFKVFILHQVSPTLPLACVWKAVSSKEFGVVLKHSSYLWHLKLG